MNEDYEHITRSLYQATTGKPFTEASIDDLAANYVLAVLTNAIDFAKSSLDSKAPHHTAKDKAVYSRAIEIFQKLHHAIEMEQTK